MKAGRPLFRPEAVEAQRHRWLGRTQRLQPRSLTLLTLASLLMAAAVVAVLWGGHYTRRVPVWLTAVDASQAELSMPAALAHWVRPGQAVRLRSGDPLAARWHTLSGRVDPDGTALVSEAQWSAAPGLADGRTRAHAASMVRLIVRFDTPDAAQPWRQRSMAGPGMPQRAEMLLERRRVIDALLEPLRRVREHGLG